MFSQEQSSLAHPLTFQALALPDSLASLNICFESAHAPLLMTAGLLCAAPGLFESFGFTKYRPNYINFVMFQLIISPVDEVLTFATNLLSRKFEYQADAFAVKLGHAEDLKGGLRVLDRKNKAPANVDWLYSAAHHSHPVLAERLHAIDTLSKKQK